MLFHKLPRVVGFLAIMTLLAVSCGAEAAVDPGPENAAANTSDTSADDAAEPAADPTAQAAEPTAPAAETQASTGEDEDATGAPDDGAIIDSREDAVAFIVSEGFVPRDAECLADGAYEVFGTWDFADRDPDPSQDEDLDAILDTCITVVPGPTAGSPPPGSDAGLDALWIACDGGSASACDSLYFESPVDSDYEAFGLSCGGRAIDICSDVLGDDSGETSGEVDSPAAGSPPPGRDAGLDALWTACDGGSADACADLFWQSPSDSDYEAFGLSCGGRSVDFCSGALSE